MVTNRQMSQRKAVRSALERIETLEQDLTKIANGLNQVFGQIDERLSKASDTLDAIVATIGENEVSVVREELRTKRIEAQEKSAREALEKAVTDGVAIKREDITENSLLVGSEKDKDGNVKAPGRMQLTFQTLKPEFKDALLGKGVGTVVNTPDGGSFEITEIYDIIVPQDVAPAPLESAPVEAEAATTSPDVVAVQEAAATEPTESPVTA